MMDTPVTAQQFIDSIDVSIINDAVLLIVTLSVSVAIIVASAVMIKKLIRMAASK